MILAETDKAYIAGIIDGEGSLGIYERGRPPTRCQTPSFMPTIRVAMTDREAIDFIAERFKGRVNKYKHKDRTKPQYVFDLFSRKEIIPFLDAVRPYLKVKALNADLMLEFLALPFYKGGVGHFVPDAIIEKRRFYVNEMHILNSGEV